MLWNVLPLMPTRSHIRLSVVAAGANVNDHKLLDQTLCQMIAPRPIPGPEQPQGLCLDKGYDLSAYPPDRGGAPAGAAPAHARRGGGGQGTPARPAGPALGGGAHGQLAQPLPPPAGAVGKESRQLQGHAWPCLRLHHFPTSRLI